MATILKNSLALIEPLMLATLNPITVTNYDTDKATIVVLVGQGGLARPREVALKNWCSTFNIPASSMLGTYLSKLVALQSAMRMYSCTNTDFFSPTALKADNGWGDHKSCYFTNHRLRSATALAKTGAEILTGTFTTVWWNSPYDTNSRCILWSFGGLLIASNFYSETADDHVVYTALLIDSAYTDDKVLLPLLSLSIDDISRGCIYLNANPTAYVHRDLVTLNMGSGSEGPVLELAPKSKILEANDKGALEITYGNSRSFWPDINLRYGENYFGQDEYGERVWGGDSVESVYVNNRGEFIVERSELEDDDIYEEEMHSCEECGYGFPLEDMVRLILDGETRFLCRNCADSIMNDNGVPFSQLTDGFETCRLIGCRFDDWITPELPFNFESTPPVFAPSSTSQAVTLALKNGKRSPVLRILSVTVERNLTLVHRFLNGIYEPRYIFTPFITEWVAQGIIELHVQQPMEGIGEDAKTVIAFPRKVTTNAEQ